MKTYAVEVFFDSDFDSYVRKLWRICDENKLSTYMNRINGVEPHIALALYSGIDVSSLVIILLLIILKA